MLFLSGVDGLYTDAFPQNLLVQLLSSVLVLNEDEDWRLNSLKYNPERMY